ncbi:hypothetical protein ACOME3_010054 [Neoechinorhynchus agilis]
MTNEERVGLLVKVQSLENALSNSETRTRELEMQLNQMQHKMILLENETRTIGDYVSMYVNERQSMMKLFEQRQKEWNCLKRLFGKVLPKINILRDGIENSRKQGNDCLTFDLQHTKLLRDLCNDFKMIGPAEDNQQEVWCANCSGSVHIV